MSAFKPNPALVRETQPLDSLEGVIERITFHNEDNGYTVARLLPPNARDVITIIGNFSNPVVGESLVCYGTWTRHAQWGRQMNVARYETVRPATAFAIEKYLGSGMVKGIGPTYAKRIVEKFGENALDVIEQTPKKLMTVPGLGEKRVGKIIAAWADQREIRNIMLFLQGHGVSPAYAVRIYKTYGDKAIEVVEKNPYQLAADIWGIGFKSADKIARAMGIEEHDSRRIEAGVVYVLNEAVETGGNAFLTEDELGAKAAEILGVEDVGAAIDALAFGGKLVLEPLEFMGQTEVAIYTPSLHTTERGLAEKLLKLAAVKLPVPKEIPALDDWLSDEQKDAVRLAVTSRFCVLTGGPGTGKTSTTKTVVAAFEALGKSVLLASPTGRAAKRLSEVTEREASTVHRLLAFDPEQRGFKHNSDNPLECDVLIVDESSMLDMVLSYSLLKAVPETAQVLFVGDVDQLPSVGPGNVLRDLIDSGCVPVARLSQVFRQAAQSLIITNAHAINQGRFPQLPPPSAGKDCAWLDGDEAEDVAEKVVAVVAKSLPKRGWKPADIQVLTPMQRGSAGAQFLNQRLQEVLNPPEEGKDEVQKAGRLYRVGDRVMQIRNNYDKNVFNGDIGTVTAIDHSESLLTVTFADAQGETETVYDFADLDELVLAYAVSVHKCVRETERVATECRGLVAIKELRVGERIHTGGGPAQRVLAKVFTGEKPVVRVTTQLGYRIDVSEEHPLLVSDGGLPKFARAQDLTPGAFACLSRAVVEGQSVGLPLLPVLPNAGRRGMPTICLPETLDAELAWWLGAAIGDGSYRDKADGTVDFTHQDPEILRRFACILEGYGLRVCTYQSPTRTATRLYVISRAFRQWLEHLGLDYCTACAKRVPPLMFQATADMRAAFLQGLFDTDGSAGRGSCRLCRFVTCSPGLAEDVQQLLLSLGIIAARSRSGPNAWCISVSGTSLARFARRVGFSVPYKQERLEILLHAAARRPGKTNHDRLPFSDLLMAECRAAVCARYGLPRSASYARLPFALRRRLYQLRNKVQKERQLLNHRDIADLRKLFEEMALEIPETLRQACHSDALYDKVAAVQPLNETAPMYDIEVEGIHSFVGNGFVCHNSQGSEYPVVVLAIHTQHYMLLQRNLLYTALTRARKFAVLIGPQRAIAMAVKKQSDIKRRTRLKERLQGAI